MATIDNMPTLKALGFTSNKANNQFIKNRDALEKWRGQILDEDVAGAVFTLMCEAGSLKNAGGYMGIASACGCTYEQAKTIVSEVVAGFDAWLQEQ